MPNSSEGVCSAKPELLHWHNKRVLLVAATPIGNIADHSPRLLEALRTADLIVAEDTRHSKSLASLLGVTTRNNWLAAHEYNEREQVEKVLDVARTKVVLVLTDAGTPAISDPGFILVRSAHEQGIPVSVIPGPSAVISALAVSGLPTDRFTFEGFVPKKGRREFLEELRSERRTMVFFDSPHRLPDTLREMAEVFGGERLAAVCRELTKKFEQVSRDSLAALADAFAEGARGEITLVVQGAPKRVMGIEDALREVKALVDSGVRLTDAAKQVAKQTGLPKRDLYEATRSLDA